MYSVLILLHVSTSYHHGTRKSETVSISARVSSLAIDDSSLVASLEDNIIIWGRHQLKKPKFRISLKEFSAQRVILRQIYFTIIKIENCCYCSQQFIIAYDSETEASTTKVRIWRREDGTFHSEMKIIDSFEICNIFCGEADILGKTFQMIKIQMLMI